MAQVGSAFVKGESPEDVVSSGDVSFGKDTDDFSDPVLFFVASVILFCISPNLVEASPKEK